MMVVVESHVAFQIPLVERLYCIFHISEAIKVGISALKRIKEKFKSE